MLKHNGGTHSSGVGEHDPGRGDDGSGLAGVLAAARTATADIAVITDAEQLITYMSASFTAMTGYGPADLIGENCRVLQGPGTDPGTTRQIKDLLASGQVFEGEILNYRKDGSVFWAELKIVPMWVGTGSEVTHYVSVQRDISNKVALLKQLEAQAIHDRVTGLPNRIAAERAVDEAVQYAPDGDRRVAVGLIDLDDFRVVNNTLGHAAGDSVLQQWATRVLARLRDGDVLARMGGDEFLLILGSINRATLHEDLPGIMDRLHEAVEKPFTVNDQQISIGMSMGIAVVPEDGTDSQSILRSADEALYAAKERRSDGASWWETAANAHTHPGGLGSRRSAGGAWDVMGLGSREGEGTESSIYRKALRCGNVVVHFQPIVDLRDGLVTLFEALARLEVPGGRIANPDEFLPHLDPADLRILFDHVLDQGLALIAGWDRPGVRPNIAVNLPPEILHDITLVSSIGEQLRTHNIEPGGLGLELLESQTLSLETQRAALQQLSEIGVRLAMDDLGSGHSSLQRLSSFPFTAIKLDRGLFLHVYARPLETLSIMATLLQMGRDLGMTVVIEGLEDEALTEAASILGVPLGQGYYWPFAVERG
ncbi:diguanylate cyclase (GGDEF)-like protein/PAS domain S-box-containing protein [Arthrobacter sp. CAN_A2]|uniref:putative bifunctional diguanylate cyclase/phosphodiesterase n=1 Tax=Arthrobacter sp. CAN_A2 TaxID=2787718 RepID=UPI0018F03019